ITNGKQVTPFSYPFMVSIYDQKTNQPFCSGVLISSKAVITAGHCIASHLRTELQIKINRHNLALKDEDEGGFNSYVEQVYLHPSYDSNNKGIKNDIAILILEDRVFRDENSSKERLGVNNSKIHFPLIDEMNIAKKVSSKLNILGWGSIYSNGPYSKTLLIGQIPVFEPLTCYNYLSKVYDIDFRQEFCAGFDEGTIDACQGDSGGPALYFDKNNNNPVLVGIISFGFKCGRPNTPGIYTRVFNYKDWIK
ncbi:trypsin-like serine protease, partial [Neoconidiobolus thromboides FSU 785]